MPNKYHWGDHVGDTDTQRAKTGSKSRPSAGFKQASTKTVGMASGAKKANAQNIGGFNGR